MVVQHNLTAMNANRMLGITTKAQAKSTERLSSGYKINRAADDAAGLSISEKMRKQIRGLTQASANAQDGISAVQTAEGALTEVHSMLQRMNELAVKSANETNSSDDRSFIQNEIDQLVVEIDRVATTTKFNETYLLKGKSASATADLSYTTASTNIGTVGTGALTFNKDGVATVSASTTGSLAYATTSGTGAAVTSSVTDGTAIKVGDITYQLYANATDEQIDAMVTSGSVSVFKDKTDFEAAIKSAISGDAKSVSLTGTTVEISAFANKNENLNFGLHVGADSTLDNVINVDIEMMSARGLGVNGLKVDGEDGSNATAAIDTISAAIRQVSTQRSALGAVQNRLDHTINNLDNVVENTTAAESQIRDTDMATEMVKYSNNNILAQAGQSMLAQANQSNQGVLSLLG